MGVPVSGPELLENIRIVLVAPQGAANVGAAARAMKNMGLRHLVAVQPQRLRMAAARTFAVHGADVLENMRLAASLDAAVAGCALVVGTTAREGAYRAHAASPREAAPQIVAHAVRQPVALVFGPEDRGLTNDELKRCHRLIRIPTAPAYPSLNLAQAVLLCAYELWLAAASPELRPAPALATAEQVEFACQRLQAALLRIGFLRGDNPDHIMFALRRLFGRAGLEERDVRILLGIARQIEWFGSAGWRREEEAGSHPAPRGGVARGAWNG